MRLRSLLLAGVALTLAVPLALADDYASGAITTQKTDKGEVLADSDGMTLYTFDKDTKGASSCYDACATKWPPVDWHCSSSSTSSINPSAF